MSWRREIDMKWSNLFKGKGIVGRALSAGENHIRIVRSRLEGGKLHLLTLQDIALHSKEPELVRQAMISSGIPHQESWAVSLMDPGLKVKKVEIPVMPGKEIPKALRWQLLGETDYVDPEIMIRYTPLKDASPQGKMEYLVYGASRKFIEGTQHWARQVGLKALVGEPVAVSLMAWLQMLKTHENKVRAILFLREGQGGVAGALGHQLLFWRSFILPQAASEKGSDLHGTPLNGEMAVNFQKYLDHFLFENQFNKVDELLLAGDWDTRNSEEIGSSLGIACSIMGSSLPPSVVLSEACQQKELGFFAAEIGLSVYPEREI